MTNMMNGNPSESPEALVRRALEEGLDRIRSYIRARLADPGHADEVLQVFCARALERARDLKEAGAARTWLSRVLATTIADYHRGLVRQQTRETPMEERHLTAVADETDADKAVCACILTLLDALPVGDAALIRRIDLEEQDRARVAADLGLNLNALTVRLHRARERLRTLVLRLCTACAKHGFDDCECPAPGATEVGG
ncbi:MAG TPA: sigma factor [Caulobacterales bacterium]|nr:sigma factor [Caulobacterales bacterium]